MSARFWEPKAARLLAARLFSYASGNPSRPVVCPMIPPGGPWRVAPLWQGETVFVIAGGPSVAELDLETIRGRKVIAVNSSYERAPFAQFIFFGDGRWHEDHKDNLESFAGRLVTVSNMPTDPRILKLKRFKPSGGLGFAESNDTLASQRTSLQGAMNLAAHLGAKRIVLLGADMARAANGRSHHHKPHRWTNRPGNVTWDEQLPHLKWIVTPLARRGIEVVNCSLVSRITWWPKMSLSEFLDLEKVESDESSRDNP